MPTFIWKGRTASGRVESGEMVAENQSEVLKALRTKKVIPVSVKPKPKDVSLVLFGGGKKLSTKELSIFTRQFATMINAGLALMDCLDTLKKQATKPGFKTVLTEVMEDIEGGATLADALARQKRTFSNLYINMVAAGEAGGALDTILLRLASYLEKTAEIIRKIKGAMIYPVMILLVTVGAVSILLLFVIPIFANMYSGMGAELPGLTKVIMDISSGLRKWWWLAGGIMVGLFIITRIYYRTSNGRLVIDRLMLRVPVFGDLLRKTALARFSRTLSTLLSSGVNILDALEITAKTSGNKVVENAIMNARASIKEGETIAAPLAVEKQVFPPMVIQMVSIGEATGGIDDMLNKVADFYESEVDQAVENLMAALEPIIIVVLGAVIGVIVVAMYLPIFKLASTFMGGE
ncbi:MAG: type II secretion system F family protein [Candidatus Cloacimonadota bacterium]|nr:MAG: type II secretion system F family protein [Candidatus Cloacimonadota bacterium]